MPAETPEHDKACEEYRDNQFCSGPGVVWCGQTKEGFLAADKLALYAAPILWFSPDEPLLPPPTLKPANPDSEELWRRRNLPLPQMLQVVDTKHCQNHRGRTGCELSGGAFVYWRITRLLLHDAGQSKVTDQDLDRGRLYLPGIRTLMISYFFYYERDEGVNPHYNDVEGIEMEIDIEAADKKSHGDIDIDAKRHAVVTRVTGLGHGSQLLSNILQIKKSVRQRGGAPDVTFPITILVEEGKHASAPDRNGDGSYTPGYDVNVRVGDAWGVRDVFGAGVVASRTRESMTKPRKPADRVGPHFDENLLRATSIEAPAQCYATRGGLMLPKEKYTLETAPECKEGDSSDFCKAVRELELRHDDQAFYKDACLGGPVEIKQAAQENIEKPLECNFLNMAHGQKAFVRRDRTGFRFKYLYGDKWFLQPIRFFAPSVRTEATAVGPQMTWFSPFGFPKFGGWIAARAALVHDGGEWHWRADINHSPSLARLADWYAAVGYDWGVERRPRRSNGISERERFDGWATEAGIQIRYREVWLRVGARFSLSAGRFSQPRVVSELGFGPQPKHARVH